MDVSHTKVCLFRVLIVIHVLRSPAVTGVYHSIGGRSSVDDEICRCCTIYAPVPRSTIGERGKGTIHGEVRLEDGFNELLVLNGPVVR